jgi:hypothetical protein
MFKIFYIKYYADIAHPERAVVLPLFSVIALSIFAVLVILGLNSYIVRQATEDLRSRVNTICAESISSDFFFVGREALEQTFKNSAKQFQTAIEPRSYVKLESLHFLLPNLPDSSWFNSLEDTNVPYQSHAIAYSSLIGKSCSGFASDSTSSDSTSMNNDCMFYGDSTFFPQGYIPENLINNTFHARHALVCAASAEIKRILLSPLSVKVSSAYKKELAGHFPLDSLPLQGLRKLSEQKGLILAVAPHLTTNSQLSKFRFSNSLAVGLKKLFDPLNNYQPGKAQGFLNVQKTQTNFQLINISGKVQTLTKPDRISAKFHAAEWLGNNDQISSFSNPNKPDDYQEFLTACMNPLVLARNAFLATLTQLFEKHGNLRSSTEVLLIGTKHRNVPNEISLSVPNQPSVIVPFGADLLRPDLDQSNQSPAAMYQTPYVIYHSGDLQTNLVLNQQKPPIEMGEPKAGMIDPTNNPVVNQFAKHQALIAGQLRFCNHLYTCSGAAGEDCSGSLARFLPEQLYDQSLDSPDYKGVLALRPKFGSMAWDQDCPFGLGPNCADGGGDFNSRPRFSGLTATEVLASLGTIQSCPYEQQYENVLCQKPIYNSDPNVNMSRDLQPDYLGLMRYLSGLDMAVTAPGFSKLTSPVNLSKPYDSMENPNIYQSAKNYRAPLLIITHQLPHLSEIQEIARILENDRRWLTRSITIIFIPYEPAQEVDVNGLERFEIAFKLRDPLYSNKLYVFSPSEVGLPLTSDNYLRYWQGLLDTESEPLLNSEQSVVYKALNLFNAKLSSVKRIL